MLTAPWFLAIIGFLINAIITAPMLYVAIKRLPKPEPPQPTAAEVAAAAPPPVIWNFKTEAIQELITELKDSKESLISDHKDLATLQAQVSAERQEVEKVKLEVVRLRNDLDRRVVEVQESEAKNLKTLAQTYSTMSPPAAAPILRELDEDTVVKILSLMKVERVGTLLAELAKPTAADRGGDEAPARRAARISDKLRLMKTLKKEVAQ